jgi:hypothetical protein
MGPCNVHVALDESVTQAETQRECIAARVTLDPTPNHSSLPSASNCKLARHPVRCLFLRPISQTFEPVWISIEGTLRNADHSHEAIRVDPLALVMK